MKYKTLRSFDGTRIVYEVGGEGDRWLVVANGYGGTFCAWDDLFARLAPRFRLLLWDYRGLHRSEIPADRARLRVEDHCRDLDLIRRAEGIERMVMAGWSVGVQVALETYRRRPEAVEALLLINGAHGRVIQRSLGGARWTGALLPPGLRGLRRATPLLQPTLLPALQRLARTPLAPVLLRAAGVFRADSPNLRESVVAILGLDYDAYFRMGLLADQHDTEDLLPHVAAPTLVLAGDRDFITRPALARHVADAIPGGVYRQVDGATHYGLMEYPDQYAAHILEFLAAHPPPARSA
jgi:pimeloyl-ACP methyl ester carboxylesterase